MKAQEYATSRKLELADVKEAIAGTLEGRKPGDVLTTADIGALDEFFNRNQGEDAAAASAVTNAEGVRVLSAAPAATAENPAPKLPAKVPEGVTPFGEPGAGRPAWEVHFKGANSGVAYAYALDESEAVATCLVALKRKAEHSRYTTRKCE